MEFDGELATGRRMHPRYALQSDLIVNRTSGKAFKAMSLNVSEGGMMVCCDGFGLDVGERLFIELVGRLRFRLGFLVAEVVHERDDLNQGLDTRHFGLKFTQLTKLQRETLRGIFN